MSSFFDSLIDPVHLIQIPSSHLLRFHFHLLLDYGTLGSKLQVLKADQKALGWPLTRFLPAPSNKFLPDGWALYNTSKVRNLER